MSTKNIKDFLTPEERLEANARSQVSFEMWMAQGRQGLEETMRKFWEIDRAKSQSDKLKAQAEGEPLAELDDARNEELVKRLPLTQAESFQKHFGVKPTRRTR